MRVPQRTQYLPAGVSGPDGADVVIHRAVGNGVGGVADAGGGAADPVGGPVLEGGIPPAGPERQPGEFEAGPGPTVLGTPSWGRVNPHLGQKRAASGVKLPQ